MRLIAEDCVKVDDKLYLFCRDYNLFYSVNLENGDLVLEGGLPGMDFMGKQLCRKMVYWNGYLIFLPYNARSIYMYHLFDRKWDEIPFEEDQFGRDDWLFFQAILHNDYLFVFGGKYSKIIKMNLQSRKMEYIEIFKDVYGKIEHNNDVFLRGGYVKQNNTYIFPIAISNHVVRLNLKTLKYHIVTVGKETDLYSGIVWDGQSFWLSPRKVGDIIRWDGEDKVKRYKLPDIYEDGKIYFSGVYMDQGVILLPDLHSDRSIRIDVKRETLTVEEASYTFVKNDEGYTCKFMLNGELFFEGDTYKKQFRCEIADVLLAKYFQKNRVRITINMDNRVIVENDCISLAVFCQSIINR